MAFLDGTGSFGSGTHTTVEAPGVDCPNCGETVFTEVIGDLSCDSCGETFHASNHQRVECPALVCDDCGETISFIRQHRSNRGPFETYHCHYCGRDIGIQTPEGVIPTEIVLQTDWLLNGREVNEAWTSFEGEYWITRAQTRREQAAVDSLNIEAKRNNPSFISYTPDNTKAHLCGTDDYCIGYITWNEDQEEPELGQLFILPTFRRQGIGQGFVKAWRSEVSDSSSRFRVNNPNADMYRLLRSLGAVEITKEGLDFPGCIITGSKVDVPEEWGPDMA